MRQCHEKKPHGQPHWPHTTPMTAYFEWHFDFNFLSGRDTVGDSDHKGIAMKSGFQLGPGTLSRRNGHHHKLIATRRRRRRRRWRAVRRGGWGWGWFFLIFFVIDGHHVARFPEGIEPTQANEHTQTNEHTQAHAKIKQVSSSTYNNSRWWWWDMLLTPQKNTQHPNR